jgi:hypothetical protein
MKKRGCRGFFPYHVALIHFSWGVRKNPPIKSIMYLGRGISPDPSLFIITSMSYRSHRQKISIQKIT